MDRHVGLEYADLLCLAKKVAIIRSVTVATYQLHEQHELLTCLGFLAEWLLLILTDWVHSHGSGLAGCQTIQKYSAGMTGETQYCSVSSIP